MAMEDYRRRAGVELVENRIFMAAQLGTDVVVMHVPPLTGPGASPMQWDQTRRTLGGLEPSARLCGIRIAIENGNYNDIERLLALYPPGYLGLCYDSGHGDMDGGGLRLTQMVQECQ